MATNSFLPLSSFQRRLESRKGGRVVKGAQVLAGGALGCHALVVIPARLRQSGMDSSNHWIPACAGMTRCL